jgi:4-hydroxybenzoate polyprenyltransferase
MKLLSAFFRLIRWPNLLFIVITQLLFYYCIVLTAADTYAAGTSLFLSWKLFWLLVLSSVLIAAAGYIINDYFDLNIDQVNKPDAIVIQKIIRRRWAIVWHLTLSIIGVIIAFYVSWKIRSWIIGPANLLCVLVLLFYSTTFKKKFLVGNVLISLLTAWVVFVLYISELDVSYFLHNTGYQAAMKKIFKLAVLYAGFAFIISLIREVVKDMEDIQGDEKYGCRTMPITWGIPASKVFAAVWLLVLILAIVVIQVYGVLLGWYAAVAYGLLLIVLPLVMILRSLYKATTGEQFHKISNWIKLAMLTGILSMIFFKFHL